MTSVNKLIRHFNSKIFFVKLESWERIEFQQHLLIQPLVDTRMPIKERTVELHFNVCTVTQM